MPMPLWFGKINKRIFNPLELKRGKRPVISHVGRRSGRTFRTPLDAHRVDGGFIFILVYGSRSDWVQNAMAAGTAQLEIGDDRFDLVAPRVISGDEARQQLPATVKAPPDFMKIGEYLRMDLAE